jgi:hypothetical protein
MSSNLQVVVGPAQGDGLARTFSRLGWAGFWFQVVFGSLPVLVMAYLFTFSRSAPLSRSGIPFIEVLTAINLLLLLFTTFWSYRYTRLARRLRRPEGRPTESYVIRFVWTGVVASTIGMLFSMIVLLLEAGSLLFRFLKAPQAGIPVIQTTGGDAAYFVSAVDMVSLIALILTLLAELVVLMCSLWLLFKAGLIARELSPARGGA